MDNEIETKQDTLIVGEQELLKETDTTSGISLDNASYFENNLNQDEVQNEEDKDLEEVVIDETIQVIVRRKKVFPNYFLMKNSLSSKIKLKISKTKKFEIPAFT